MPHEAVDKAAGAVLADEVHKVGLDVLAQKAGVGVLGVTVVLNENLNVLGEGLAVAVKRKTFKLGDGPLVHGLRRHNGVAR